MFLIPLLVSVGIPELLGVVRIPSLSVNFEMEPGELDDGGLYSWGAWGERSPLAKFEYRTFGTLLSQPRSRWKLYRKTGAPGAGSCLVRGEPGSPACRIRDWGARCNSSKW